MSETRSQPRREIAWLTYSILAANLVAFVVCGLRSGNLVAMQLPAGVLVEMGANVAPFTQFAGNWETLCTSTFLHGGLVHLLFNLVALVQVGPLVEAIVGRARFSILYVAAGLGASLASMLAANYAGSHVGIAVGASGAICGLIGGSAVLGFRLQGRRSPLALSMLRWLGFTVVLGYAVSLGGGVSIDNTAHLGGAVVGGLCALSFRRSVTYRPLGRAARIAGCVALCLAAFAVKVSRREPAWTYAKLECLSQRGNLGAHLAALGVPAAAADRITARCDVVRR